MGDALRFPTGPRYDRHGRLNLMARSSGYVMVRRSRCTPFVLTEKGWLKLAAEPWPAELVRAVEEAERVKREQSEEIARFIMGGRRDG